MRWDVFQQACAKLFHLHSTYEKAGHIDKQQAIFVQPEEQENENMLERNFLDKGLEEPCRENTLQKSGLEPKTPNRPADRRHGRCFMDSTKYPSAFFFLGAVGSSLDFSRVFFHITVLLALGLQNFFLFALLSYPGQPLSFQSMLQRNTDLDS